MVNMDINTHRILTALLYVTFGGGFLVLFLSGDGISWLPIGLYTATMVVASYSHYNYYHAEKTEEMGKVFLVIEIALVFAVTLFDKSDYEHVFILLVIGDCIFAYSYLYSISFAVIVYGSFYPLMIWLSPLIIGIPFKNDYLEDVVIVALVLTMLYMTKYQIVSRMKYDQLFAERNSAYEQLKISAKRIEAYAVKEERARIAMMLHNSLGHMLVATNMTLQAEKMELVSQGKIDKKAFTEVEVSIQKSMSLLRKAVEGEEDELLAMSLNEIMKLLVSDVANNLGMQVHYEQIDIEQVPEAYGVIVYNVVLESVTNALKHSEGTHINISLMAERSKIVIQIKDNGKGVDDFVYGFGTSRLKEQVERVGGTYKLTSDEGCNVTAIIPFG